MNWTNFLFDMGWFKHDDGFRNEPSVKYVRSKYGNDGYAVFLYLLEILKSTEGNSIPWGTLEKKIFSNDFGVTTDKIDSIVGLCCEVELLTIRDGRMSCKILDGMVKCSSGKARAAVLSRWNKKNDTSGIKDETMVQNVEQKKNSSDAEFVKTIVALWNEICTSLPKVNSINNGRTGKLRSRIKEWGGGTTAVDYAKQIFEACESSDFLTGRCGTWKASFDWIINNSTNWTKVMEGNYKNNENGRGASNKDKVIGGKVKYSDIGKAVQLGFALSDNEGE